MTHAGDERHDRGQRVERQHARECTAVLTDENARVGHDDLGIGDR